MISYPRWPDFVDQTGNFKESRLFCSAQIESAGTRDRVSRFTCHFDSFTTQFFAMPNSASAEKSLRRSNVRRDRNRQQRGALRTRLKKFRLFLADKPTQEAADKEFSLVVKALDQAASKKLLHKNAASRTKSRLAALKRKTFVS